jgi:hypothetical protein
MGSRPTADISGGWRSPAVDAPRVGSSDSLESFLPPFRLSEHDVDALGDLFTERYVDNERSGMGRPDVKAARLWNEHAILA